MQVLITDRCPGESDDVLSREVDSWATARSVVWADLVNNASKKWRDSVWDEWSKYDGSTGFTVTRQDGKSTVTYSFLI